jgi:hypothetical protein
MLRHQPILDRLFVQEAGHVIYLASWTVHLICQPPRDDCSASKITFLSTIEHVCTADKLNQGGNDNIWMRARMELRSP